MFLLLLDLFLGNKYAKQVVLINHSWISPTLQKGWELGFRLFFKNWGGYIPLQKRERLLK